jgi:protein kinase/serine/threonine-protein kinase
MDLSAGDTLRERYALREHLGTGGFAAVWRARDTERDCDVALKLPSLHTHDKDTVLARFERERQLLEPFTEGLSHGTVVRYLDGDLGGEPRYIVLELLEGEPLSDAFGSDALGSGVRRRLATDLAETLDFLHRNNIVYLDLKPENVIVRPSGRPSLLDFNTAVRRSESVDVRFEADQFKAPELLEAGVAGSRDGTPGARADVYSWGKLAFYLLTGAKVPTENVPEGGLNPRSFGSSCSRALADVVSRATVPDPGARYEDGPALAAAVARATGRRPRVVITHPSGVTCTAGDGDTVGRFVADEPVPWLVVSDSGGHVSPQHARFERAREGWRLADESLNGTYVAGEQEWQFTLSEAGYQARVERGEADPDDPQPPTALPLADGWVLAPVHPEYGLRLRVTLPDS